MNDAQTDRWVASSPAEVATVGKEVTGVARGRLVGGGFEVTPSAARLTESLRDIGYDFPTAIADLVDNSVAAGAHQVDIDIVFDGSQSWVAVSDDGCGMTANGLLEALRYGTRRSYETGDLGRYGLGLKTAPLSQCRRVTVVTRRSPTSRLITTRTLDLDVVAEWDAWLVVEDAPTNPVEAARVRLANGPGTVVIWEKLDRILPESRPDGGWAKRRMDTYAARTSAHLGMVFHRFIEGDASSGALTITVNGEKVQPWNPFAPNEPHTVELPEQIFEVVDGPYAGDVSLKRFILPPRDSFSSLGEFERLSGPMKWNRQQGLYVYRADRLVQWGGWSGVRAIDEHTKLARAALDFNTDMDGLFHINVAKMRVTVPSVLKQMLERPLHELCIRADDAYRKTTRDRLPAKAKQERLVGEATLNGAGLALRAAAMETGHSDAFREIVRLLKNRDPRLVQALGLS